MVAAVEFVAALAVAWGCIGKEGGGGGRLEDGVMEGPMPGPIAAESTLQGMSVQVIMKIEI